MCATENSEVAASVARRESHEHYKLCDTGINYTKINFLPSKIFFMENNQNFSATRLTVLPGPEE